MLDTLSKKILDIVNCQDEHTLTENANKDGTTFSTQRDLIAGAAAKHIAREYLIPKHLIEAHDKGQIHIHDQDYAPLMPMQNCFSGKTEVITKEYGRTPFNSLPVGGVVTVPTHTGSWKKAVVRTYGVRKMVEVELSLLGRYSQRVVVTPDHRWILKDGGITTNLKVGDKLLRTPSIKQNKIDKQSFCKGFIYGDGTDLRHREKPWNGCFARLCGDKTKFASIFEDCGYTVTSPKYLKSSKDLMVYCGGMVKDTSAKCLASFVEGYLAADGCKHSGASSTYRGIQATGEGQNSFIRKWFDVAGYFLGQTRDFTGKKTNYGVRKKETKFYTIRNHTKYYWEVKNIVDAKEELAWCFEVEDDQSFILGGGIVTGNCALINLKDMLDKGCKLNGVAIEKPKSISTAMNIASQVVSAVGNSQYGGISYNRFDETMGEYVEASYQKWLDIAHEEELSSPEVFARKRIRKEVYDACQLLEYQLNTIHSTSGMSPFITINFGLGTSWQEKLIQEMILRVRMNGLGKEKVTAIFPKLIFTQKRGLNLKAGDPNYDIKKLAVECSAKRLYPDILNYDKVVEVTGSFKSSMSCRSFLSPKENENGELYHSGRCNIGVTTISLPMIAVECGGDLEVFWKTLDERLLLAKEVCEFRLEYLSKLKAKAAPILYTEGGICRLDPEDYVLPELIKRGASISIGYIGLNEVANAIFGADTLMIDDQRKVDFCKKVMNHFSATVSRFKEESGVGYSTYGTPSESQCMRLRDAIFDRFGEVSGVTDKEYLTNSFHLEASTQKDVYSRMDFESQFILMSTGGFISYGEFPDMRNNLEALEDVWTYSYDVTPYYGVNVPADKCFECGFEGEMESKSKGFVCPKCGNSDQHKMYAVRRVSGYLGEPTSRPFNKGKTKECVDRVKNM